MNKLKWATIEKEVDVDFPNLSNEKSNDIYISFFLPEDEIVFMFYEDKIVIICIEIECSIDMRVLRYIDLRMLKYKESIINIIQNDVNGFSFIIKTSLCNVYSLEVSCVDFYCDISLLCYINGEILQYEDKNFLLCSDCVLYLMQIGSKERKMVWDGKKGNNKLINAKKMNDVYVVFTKREIIVVNSDMKINKSIWKYDKEVCYKGEVFDNKIFYIKNSDEFAIYDIIDNNNNSSLKFSSKKAINKIAFDKILYVNEDIIVLVNQMDSELYVYSQKNNYFNRETFIFNNRKFIVNCQYIFCLGLNVTSMKIRGKYAQWNKEKKVKIIEKENNVEITQDLPLLNDLEDEYENKKKLIILSKKKQKSLQIQIKKFLSDYQTFRDIKTYILIKDLIMGRLKEIYIFNLSTCNLEFYQYAYEIYISITDKYINSFGSRIIIYLNWYDLYLQYVINDALYTISSLKLTAIQTHDRETYNKLSNLYNKLILYNLYI